MDQNKQQLAELKVNSSTTKVKSQKYKSLKGKRQLQQQSMISKNLLNELESSQLLKNQSLQSIRVSQDDSSLARLEQSKQQKFQDIFKLPQLRKRPQLQKLSENPKLAAELPNKSDDDELLAEIDKSFHQNGLSTNKKLKNYDCWDETIQPAQWVEKYKNDPDHHALCPIFQNNQ